LELGWFLKMLTCFSGNGVTDQGGLKEQT